MTWGRAVGASNAVGFEEVWLNELVINHILDFVSQSPAISCGMASLTHVILTSGIRVIVPWSIPFLRALTC